MFCHDFFVYVLSWFHRTFFVKHERICFVMISSYMFCHDFIVNDLSWFLRLCFVKTSSYMFCHDFFIVMSVNQTKIYFRWRGEISPFFSPLFSPHEFSWFLHRKWFVKHERKCFVMISSKLNVYVLLWLHRICFVMTSSKLNVNVLSWLHRN